MHGHLAKATFFKLMWSFCWNLWVLGDTVSSICAFFFNTNMVLNWLMFLACILVLSRTFTNFLMQKYLKADSYC